MDTHFQKELEELKENLLKMAERWSRGHPWFRPIPGQEGFRSPRRYLRERIELTKWKLPLMICA